MSVYNRKMFDNAPERLKINSRGTGITSGLVPMKPIGMENGGDPTYESLYDIYSKALGDQPKGFFAQNAGPLLQFFANLAEAGEGGKPLTGGEQSPFLSTLTGVAKAAPALANIRPYQDPAAALAAEKFAEFEIDKALTEAKAGPAELKNLKTKDVNLIEGQKIKKFGTDEEIIIGTTPGYPVGKYATASYSIGGKPQEGLIGGVDDDINLNATTKQFYNVGDTIPLFSMDGDFEVTEAGYYNVATGTKNGEEFMGLVGRAEDPDALTNVKTEFKNGKIITSYFQNGKLKLETIDSGVDDYKDVATVNLVGDEGKVITTHYFRKNGVFEKKELGTAEPTSQMIDKEKYNKAVGTIQEAWKAFQAKQGVELPDLTSEQLDRMYATVGDDNWTKITDEGVLVDKINGVFFNQILPEFGTEINAKNKGKATVESDGKIVEAPDGTNANIISYYNLNIKDPNFKNQYADAVEKYNDLPRPGPDVEDTLIKGVDNIKTLASLLKVADATTPLGEVGLYQSLAKTFGVAPFTDPEDFVEFITLKELLDLQATDLLIKGVPSNIDLRKVENLTPSGSDKTTVVLKKLQILNGFFSNALLESIAYSSGKGEILPENVLNEMREIFGNEAINDALGNKWTAQRTSDLNSMTREEYINEYGDPFEKAKSFLDQDIESYVLKSDLINTEGSENLTNKDYQDILMNTFTGEIDG